MASIDRKQNQEPLNPSGPPTPISVDPSDTATLRILVQEGIDSGPGIDADVVFAKLRKELQALQGD